MPTFPAQRSTPASCTPATSAPNPPVRRPWPRVYPAITTSCVCRSFSFCQSGVRRPGRYGDPTCLATTPSSSCWRAAASSAGPSSNCGETTTPALLPTSSSRRLRRSPSGLVEQRLGVDLEQVEENEHGGAAALLQQREAGAAVLVERADLSVEHRVGRANRERDGASDVAEPARQILAVTARERHLAAGDRHDRAKAVPLRLVDPALADGQRIGRRGEHRLVRPARGAAVLP